MNLAGVWRFRTMIVTVLVPAVALFLIFSLAGAASHSAAAPHVLTDRSAYVSGETVVLSGYGFLPFEVVSVQIETVDGAIDARTVLAPWTAFADADGKFTTTWKLDPEDRTGADLIMTATGGTSRSSAQFAFHRTAVIATDTPGYQAGSTKVIAGSNFEPNENVTLRLAYSSAVPEPSDDTAVRSVTTDATGSFSSSVELGVSGSGEVERALVASGNTSGLTAQALLLPGGFNIDGVVPDPGTLPFGDPYGAANELGPLNASATKLLAISSAPVPMLGFSNPNGQTDLRNIWLATSTSGGDTWLYFAWERDANSGSGAIAFEFEQAPRPAACDYTLTDQVDTPANTPAGEAQLIATCNPWANRQPGDFLIVWEQGGKGNTIVKRTFYLDSTGKLALDAGVTLNSAVSAAAISQDKFRGEAVLDLTKTVFPATQNTCFAIANIIPGTITGNSDTADFKDTVLSEFASHVSVSNCGEVKVTKATQPAGGTGSFPYTLARTNNQPLRFPSDGGDTSVSQTLVSDGDLDVIFKLIAGTNYTLAEGATGSAWATLSIVCGGTDVTSGGTFAVPVSQITECTITNKQQSGTLIVKKVVTNDDGGVLGCGNFSFSVNGGPAVPFNASCQNQLPADPAATYTVTESAATGYQTTYDNCRSVQVPAGGSATCTITNNDIGAGLRLVKSVSNGNGGTAAPADFQLTASGTNGFSDAGNSTTFHAVKAGTSYTLSEASIPGYAFTGWSCDAGTFVPPNTITLALGQTATCTVTNHDIAPTLRLVKSVTNDNGGTNGPADWQLTANGTGGFTDAGNSTVFHAVNAGVQYTLSESSVAGYNVTSWSCNAGTFVAPDKLTLALGQTATCTVTNDDRKATPGVTTTQRVVLHDTATIIGIRVGAPGAASTVTFRLFADPACATQIGTDETVGISLEGTTGTATTVNGVLVTAPGTYYWRAVYSGDTYNAGFTTTCGSEAATVSF